MEDCFFWQGLKYASKLRFLKANAQAWGTQVYLYQRRFRFFSTQKWFYLPSKNIFSDYFYEHLSWYMSMLAFYILLQENYQVFSFMCCRRYEKMLLMLFMLVIIVGVMKILKRVSEKKITACLVTAKTAFSA